MPVSPDAPATSAVVMDSHNEKLVQLVVASGAQTLAIDDGKSPILVAPIGKGPVQELRRYIGDGKGGFDVETLCDVRFVPLLDGVAREL